MFFKTRNDNEDITILHGFETLVYETETRGLLFAARGQVIRRDAVRKYGETNH